jgi:hypothetical protein
VTPSWLVIVRLKCRTSFSQDRTDLAGARRRYT